MKKLFVFAVLVMSMTAFAGEKDQAINKLVTDFSQAWTKADAKAMAALWTEDADLINPMNVRANGRAEIEKIFERETGQIFKGSTMQMSVEKIRWIGADYALVDVQADVQNFTDPSGKKVPSMKHHVALVTQEKDGNWSILSGRPYVFMPAPKEPAKKAKK